MFICFVPILWLNPTAVLICSNTFKPSQDKTKAFHDIDCPPSSFDLIHRSQSYAGRMATYPVSSSSCLTVMFAIYILWCFFDGYHTGFNSARHVYSCAGLSRC
ncbi:hypothetical protein C8R43DRAFT_1017066 [Mycena crocata]|nr:hypothetical protein C8R43DRAFT_1017066 [Mycena crocata]